MITVTTSTSTDFSVLDEAEDQYTQAAEGFLALCQNDGDVDPEQFDDALAECASAASACEAARYR